MRAALDVRRLVVLWLVLAAGLGLVSFSAPAYGEELQSIDIPLGHWSYEAVESLARTPLVLESEVLFDSKTSITRYEMAMLIAKMLTRLNDMGGSGQDLSGSIVSGSERQILQELFCSSQAVGYRKR